MRLRVAHIITQLELGGAQRNTLYTVSHLNADECEPFLICGTGGILDEEARSGAWPTHFIPTLVRPVHPVKDLLALIAIYKLLRVLKPQIVHTHSSKAGILGRIAAYLAGVPVILHTFHGFGFTPGQKPLVRRMFVWAEKLCAVLSTHLIYVSEDNQKEAHGLGVGSSKPWSLIRSGIRIEEPPLLTTVRKDLGIPTDAWVVISVGNFKPQKNPMDLAKTAGVVLEKDPSVYFLLVGDGPLRPAVEQEIQTRGLSKQVLFLGWRTDIPALLSSANCFLLTSLWEGLPRALVEAAVARLPSVAYAVNGVNDILIEGETGFPIPPHQAEAAAEKILWLKSHFIESRQIGRQARARVEKEFNIDTMVREQEALYRTLYDAVPLKQYYEKTA